MMFQISQGYRKFMAFGFPAVNTVFINTQNQRARMVERLFQTLILDLHFIIKYCCLLFRIGFYKV